MHFTFYKVFCAMLVQDVLPFVNCLRMAHVDRTVSGPSIMSFVSVLSSIVISTFVPKVVSCAGVEGWQ